MTGFEVFEMLYESEEVRTTPAALGEFTGQWPLHRRVGSLALNLGAMSLMPVHTARGGSHALTHALVRCFVAHGGDIWSTCPVERILVRDGRAHGVRLSPDALLPGEEIQARVVISNVTLAPTFLQMVGEDVIGSARARQIKGFNYDDPQLLGSTTRSAAIRSSPRRRTILRCSAPGSAISAASRSTRFARASRRSLRA